MGDQAPLKIVIHQPQFLPWIGFWHKIVSCDLHVVYAGVKFDQYDHEHRVTVDGRWLTVPVEQHSRHKLIKDVRLADPIWCRRAIDIIKQRIGWKTAPHRERLDEVFSLLHGWTGDWLLELDLALIRALAKALALPLLLAVDERPREELPKLERLDACLEEHSPACSCIYLQGPGGRDYLGFGSLKTPLETRFQELAPGLSADSILQTVAHEGRPLDAVRQAATWRGPRGRYDWRGREQTDD